MASTYPASLQSPMLIRQVCLDRLSRLGSWAAILGPSAYRHPPCHLGCYLGRQVSSSICSRIWPCQGYPLVVYPQQQPQGTNYCGYFVCEWIRRSITEHDPQKFIEVCELIYIYKFMLLLMIDINMLISFFYRRSNCEEICH